MKVVVAQRAGLDRVLRRYDAANTNGHRERLRRPFASRDERRVES